MHRHNNFSIDYCTYNSAIKNWNTVYKLLFALLAIVIVVAADNFLTAFFTLVYMGIINIFISKIPIRQYLIALKIPAFFILAGGIAIGINFSNEAQGIFCFNAGFAYIFFTKESLADMSGIIIKSSGAVSAMYLFTLSTPAGEFITALKKVHVPDVFAGLMYLVYRYIFILSEEVHKMRNAGEARLGYVDFKTSCKSFGMMLGNLFIVSIKNSRTYYDALEARCYNGSLNFYTEEKKCTGVQAVVMAVYFVLVILSVYATRLL